MILRSRIQAVSRPSCSESFSELRFHPGSHPRARSSTHHSPGPPWESGPPQSLPMGGSACTWAWEPQTDVALHFLFYLIATMRPTLPLILQIHLHLNTHACVTYRYAMGMYVFSRSVVSNSVAHQVPLFMEFSRQEYWSGLAFPSPGDLPNPGTEPTSLASPALAGGFFTH